VNPRRSFRFRLTLAALLPLLLAMTAAWAVATFVFTRALDQRVEQQIENAANVLTGGGLPFTTELLQRVADLQQVQIALLDANGRVIARTQGDLAVRSAETAVHDGMADFREARPRHFDVGGEPTIVVMRPVAGGSNPNVAAVLVAASLRDARDAGRSAALGIGLAVIAAGALLIVLQYLLLRGITRPVSRLVNVAHEIASGRRDVRADADRQDELQALATALNDMTDKLAKYEAELAERSRLAALGEMSARIAHEIRNPLTGLKLHLELLDERVSAPEKPTVRRLLDEVARLELIVASSLSLTRPAQATRRETDLNEAVDEVLQLMEPSLRHRQIELRRDFGRLPVLEIDRDRMKQALLNLVVNAADALPQGGALLARTRHDAGTGTITVSIEDSGPGIDPRLADPATPVSGSSKPFGLGLGLRVCREIVAEHGGRLELGRSEALGGTRAAIELTARAASGASR
jgi:signal transduction histidine kinase